jgi:hypothetical protein
LDTEDPAYELPALGENAITMSVSEPEVVDMEQFKNRTTPFEIEDVEG